MSTSTGPAYKLHKNTDLFTVAVSLEQVIEAQLIAMTQAFVDECVSEWVGYSGRPASEPLPEDFPAHMREISVKFDRQHTTVKPDHSEFSTLYAGGHASLVFYHNTVLDEVYVRLFDFKKPAVKAFEKLSFVGQSMEYYNSSDSQLEYITEEEWEYRKQAWEEVSPRNKIVKALNPKIDLVNNSYVYYNTIGLKPVGKYADMLTLPSESSLLSRVFHTKYNMFFFTEVEPPQKQGGFSSQTNVNWGALHAITKYSFSENNFDTLPAYETNMDKIAQLREESIQWLKDHPVTLPSEN